MPPNGPKKDYPDWPDAHVPAGYLRKVQEMARNLRQAVSKDGGTYPSARALAEASGIPASTITRTIAGTVIPSVETVARLEAALGYSLWPQHKPEYGDQALWGSAPTTWDEQR